MSKYSQRQTASFEIRTQTDILSISTQANRSLFAICRYQLDCSYDLTKLQEQRLKLNELNKLLSLTS